MSHSPFARAFITSAFIAGAVFTASAFPLAVFKSKVVDLELQNQTIFSSEMKDLAAPYLSISGVASVALGFGVFGLSGWRNSVRKLSNIESQSSHLAQDLAIYQAELERIKFSESRLKAQNLTAYLAPQSDAGFGPAGSTPSPVAMVAHTGGENESGLSAGLDSHRALYQVLSPDIQQPLPNPAVQPKSHDNGVQSHGAENGETLNHLLQQINQLSRQVEALQSGKSDGLAA
jgi:hypothetical protein